MTIDTPDADRLTVSHDGRLFMCFPAEETAFPPPRRDRQRGAAALSGPEINQYRPRTKAECLVPVQSVVTDPTNRLWMLGMGSVKLNSTEPGGAKLVCVDLGRNCAAAGSAWPTSPTPPTAWDRTRWWAWTCQRPRLAQAE